MDTVCILAAGLGSRLKEISAFHKALLPINNKAIISHIIDSLPAIDTEFVIAVGHQKNYIKEYCLAAHPDRKLIFVEVDNFDGVGSGPGYSLNCCKSNLQRPFYLFCVDCLVKEKLPSLDSNWIGVSEIQDSSTWSTALVEDGIVVSFINKHKNGYKNAFIGVAGIRDYQTFWEILQPGKDNEFEMVSAFYHPEKYPDGLKAHNFTWCDTGTPQNYFDSQKSISSEIKLGMSKTINELTYKINNRCVKLFENKDVCQGRIQRAFLLGNKIPELVYQGNYVYAYEWVAGSTLYEINNLEVFKKFLDWCKENLWKEISIDKNFSVLCYEFYYKKTIKRYESYLKQNPHADSNMIINGISHQESIKTLLKKIDWANIIRGTPVIFHGDLQFENVIYTPQDSFSLIDWRDSFSEQYYGDMYYDLAKMYAGLMISFNAVKLDNFECSRSDGKIDYQVASTPELKQMLLYYENWLLKNEYDLQKIRTLVAIIYLNMSPLHTQPFSDMLFNHAKYLLTVL